MYTTAKMNVRMVFVLPFFFLLAFHFTGCIGNIGELSGLLSGQSGNIYYVATDGDNQNPGTREKPWATPGYGSRQLELGDTLIILGGQYLIGNNEEDRIKPPSGTSSNWITIKGESGNRPILAGIDNCRAVIDLSGKNNIQIENLEITNDNSSTIQNAILAEGGPVQNIVLKKLFIHHIDGSGITMADAIAVEIDQCTIQYCGTGAVLSGKFQGEGWSGITIRDSHLDYSGHYPSKGKKVSPSQMSDGIQIGLSAGPIEIINTGFEHNFGSAINSQAKINRIKQCVIANNTENGIYLRGEEGIIENTLVYGMGDGDINASGGAGIVIDRITKSEAIFQIINATIHDNSGRNGYPIIVQKSTTDKSLQLILKNTIIAGGSQPVLIGKNVTLQADHNLIFQPEEAVFIIVSGIKYSQEEIENGVLGQGFLSQDPLFVTPAWGKTGDYHLKNGSPAIDKGTSIGAPELDLEGNKRPQGSGFDIGAYEYGGGEKK